MAPLTYKEYAREVFNKLTSLRRMREVPRPQDSFIPNFCGGRAVFRIILSVELVAVLLALSGTLGVYSLWPHLFLLSLYLQWIGLASCGALCLARPWLERMSSRRAVWVSFGLLLAVTFVISELAYRVSQANGLTKIVFQGSHLSFLLRNLLICAIVSAVILRYLYMQHVRDAQIRTGAEARFLALQARMRPHFLFNSLNSIAALISLNPSAAEEMVEDLAELFRASLNAMERSVPLSREVEITRMYINIESARLGERLRVVWQVDEDVQNAHVPILTLQPLVENAVYHGIEQLPQGGKIHIGVRRDGDYLVFEVVNPLPKTERSSRGQRIALDNITQRLYLMFGEAASVVLERGEDNHHVRLMMPIRGEQHETGHRRRRAVGTPAPSAHGR